jgi:hypothetical protein
VNEIADGNSLLVNYRNEIDMLKKQLEESQQMVSSEELVALQVAND